MPLDPSLCLSPRPQRWGRRSLACAKLAKARPGLGLQPAALRLGQVHLAGLLLGLGAGRLTGVAAPNATEPSWPLAAAAASASKRR